MLRYRKANLNDIDELVDLRLRFLSESRSEPGAEPVFMDDSERELLINSIDKYFYEAMCDRSFAALIAKYNNRIVATSGLTIYRLPPNRDCVDGVTGYVSNMYTLPEFRRRGIAARLFSLTMDEARRSGCSQVILYATEMGRPIYEKYGFRDRENEMIFRFNSSFE